MTVLNHYVRPSIARLTKPSWAVQGYKDTAFSWCGFVCDSEWQNEPWCCCVQPWVHWSHRHVHSDVPEPPSTPCSAAHTPTHTHTHARTAWRHRRVMTSLDDAVTWRWQPITAAWWWCTSALSHQTVLSLDAINTVHRRQHGTPPQYTDDFTFGTPHCTLTATYCASHRYYI